MAAWVGYYVAHSIAILVFCGLTAWALKNDWEDTAIVFGIALLVTGCNVVVPS